MLHPDIQGLFLANNNASIRWKNLEDGPLRIGFSVEFNADKTAFLFVVKEPSAFGISVAVIAPGLVVGAFELADLETVDLAPGDESLKLLSGIIGKDLFDESRELGREVVLNVGVGLDARLLGFRSSAVFST